MYEIFIWEKYWDSSYGVPTYDFPWGNVFLIQLLTLRKPKRLVISLIAFLDWARNNLPATGSFSSSCSSLSVTRVFYTTINTTTTTIAATKSTPTPLLPCWVVQLSSGHLDLAIATVLGYLSKRLFTCSYFFSQMWLELCNSFKPRRGLIIYTIT